MGIKFQSSDYKGSWDNHIILVRSRIELNLSLIPASTLWELRLDGDLADETDGSWMSGKSIALIGKIDEKNSKEVVEIYIETRAWKKQSIVAKVAGKSITLKEQK